MFILLKFQCYTHRLRSRHRFRCRCIFGVVFVVIALSVWRCVSLKARKRVNIYAETAGVLSQYLHETTSPPTPLTRLSLHGI